MADLIDRQTKRVVEDPYRYFNYHLCHSIDLIHLGVTLDDMVEQGKLSRSTADLYLKHAESLLKLLILENDRAFGMVAKPGES